MIFSQPYYWNHDAPSRAFAARYAKAYKGQPPTAFQASTWCAVTHYLKAVQAAGTDATGPVMRRCRFAPLPSLGRIVRAQRFASGGSRRSAETGAQRLEFLQGFQQQGAKPFVLRVRFRTGRGAGHLSDRRWRRHQFQSGDQRRVVG